MSKTISNTDDLIDSRDVIARIEELESERADLATEAENAAADPATARGDGSEAAALAEWDDENGAELKALQELADGAEGYAPDWRHGCTLIRDSYFQDYAQELAEDIGAIPKNNAWPCTCIDWARAACELQMDYTSVEFGDVTYWVQ